MWGLNAFQLLVDDLGEVQALKSLGVNERTFRKWLGGKLSVPRCAVLALYWESNLGRSLIAADHHNEVTTLNALVRSLRDENALLRDRLGQLEAGRHWSANDTFFDPGAKRHTQQEVRVAPAPAHPRQTEVRTAPRTWPNRWVVRRTLFQQRVRWRR